MPDIQQDCNLSLYYFINTQIYLGFAVGCVSAYTNPNNYGCLLKVMDINKENDGSLGEVIMSLLLDNQAHDTSLNLLAHADTNARLLVIQDLLMNLLVHQGASKEELQTRCKDDFKHYQDAMLQVYEKRREHQKKPLEDQQSELNNKVS